MARARPDGEREEAAVGGDDELVVHPALSASAAQPCAL
jgi:hypothetical protein